MYFHDIETLLPFSPCLLYADARGLPLIRLRKGEGREGKSEAACVFNTPPPHPPLPSFPLFWGQTNLLLLLRTQFLEGTRQDRVKEKKERKGERRRRRYLPGDRRRRRRRRRVPSNSSTSLPLLLLVLRRRGITKQGESLLRRGKGASRTNKSCHNGWQGRPKRRRREGASSFLMHALAAFLLLFSPLPSIPPLCTVYHTPPTAPPPFWSLPGNNNDASSLRWRIVIKFLLLLRTFNGPSLDGPEAVAELAAAPQAAAAAAVAAAAGTATPPAHSHPVAVAAAAPPPLEHRLCPRPPLQQLLCTVILPPFPPPVDNSVLDPPSVCILRHLLQFGAAPAAREKTEKQFGQEKVFSQRAKKMSPRDAMLCFLISQPLSFRVI